MSWWYETGGVVRRRRGSWLIPAVGVLTVVIAAITAAAIDSVTTVDDRWPWGLEAIRAHPFGWSLVLTVVAIAIATWTWWVRRDPGGPESQPPVSPPPEWVVDRPAEVDKVVAALCRRAGHTVGITTALQGAAGGFGKTTLAQMVCADRRIRRHFSDRVYLVTIGREVRDDVAVATKVNDVITLITGEDATFTDPQLAGQRLGALLDEQPQSLLVLDDVWDAEQLDPFLHGGRSCTRLVTTRIPSILVGRGVAVSVDQMSVKQARQVLTWGLPPLPSAVVTQLVAATGRWPLLLRR